MPVAATLELSGSVIPSGDLAATFLGTIDGAIGGEATLAGTVDRTALERLDASVSLFGVRVTLGDRDVTADLVGSVTVERSIDEPLCRAAFTLDGRRFLPTTTETTWTRTPVSIYFLQGPPGDVAEHLEFEGVVDTCQVGADRRVQVEVMDRGELFARLPLCFELEPLAGLTRGEIVRQLAGRVGLGADVHDGAVYSKPVHTGGAHLFDFLGPFGEPEGWHFRVEGDQLIAYSPELRRAPETPDHVWHVGELDAHPSLTPPTDVPSRRVLRGTTAVELGEAGLETSVTETEITGLYRVKEAIWRQQTDGSLAPVVTTSREAVQPISRLRDELTRRGDQPVRQVTTEWGWYNPAAGKWRTPFTNEPPGLIEEGYRYTEAWIDTEGRYVSWRAERWVEIGRRVQTWRYDAEGNAVELVVATSRWHRRSRAVRRTSGVELRGGAAVGDDDKSWAIVGPVKESTIEIYGQAETQVVAYAYDPETGAVRTEDQVSSGYYSPQAAIDPALGYWLLSDGTAQTEEEAGWRQVSRQTKRNLLDASGRLQGEVTLHYGHFAPQAVSGVRDWGSFRSNAEEESFGLLRTEQREIRTESEGSYAEVEYSEGERRESLHLGAPPMPRYRSSPWTRLVQAPLEVELESPVLRAWFGPAVEIFEHPHVETPEEGLALLERRFDREVSHELQVWRPETLADLGDTVELIDPELGLRHRALVVALRKVREPRTGRATGEYTLEVPLR